MVAKQHLILTIILIVLIFLITACGAADSETIEINVTRVVSEEAVEGETVEEFVTSDESELEEAAEEALTEEEPVEELSENEEDPISAIGSEDATGDLPPTPQSGAKVESTRSPNTTGESNANPDVRSGGEEGDPGTTATSTGLTVDQPLQLTAGEIDDNVLFNAYLAYLSTYEGSDIIPIAIQERHRILVTDNQENPVLGAVIRLSADNEFITELRTHSDGTALFFPGMFGQTAVSYQAEISVNGSTRSFVLPADDGPQNWQFIHPAAGQIEGAQLDILFLLDATGSMADEINQLKENIRAISAQIEAFPLDLDVRFGMVAYRDRGDDFLTQQTQFTDDIEEFAVALSAVEAAGGGDYAEDLNSALDEAINSLAWRIDGTVSLIFLIADAPPHLDYDQTNHYARSLEQANNRGIKIYPIASSGLDSQGEYIFRQLAQITNGRFIFLTYAGDGSGTPGSTTTLEVSDYTVSSLDSLVVRLIEEELAPLTR